MEFHHNLRIMRHQRTVDPLMPAQRQLIQSLSTPKPFTTPQDHPEAMRKIHNNNPANLAG